MQIKSFRCYGRFCCEIPESAAKVAVADAARLRHFLFSITGMVS